MIRGYCYDLVRDLKVADEFLFLPENWRAPWLSGQKTIEIARTASKQWRAGAPDWVLIPRAAKDFSGAAYYAAWTGSPRVCAQEALCRDSWRNLTPLCRFVVPRSEEWIHQVEEHRRMLQFLELDASDVEPRLVIPEAARKLVEDKLGPWRTDQRLIAMCVGAGVPDKRWPIESFVAAAREILSRHADLQIVLLGSMSEREDAELVRMEDPQRVFNACGQFSLLESAALLERCKLYIGNDTGPMHLAATVGLPVIEISKHPKTAGADCYYSPVRFGPRAAWWRALQPEQPAAPECIHGCEKNEAHCIKAVSVKDAIDAVEEALALKQKDGHAECSSPFGASIADVPKTRTGVFRGNAA